MRRRAARREWRSAAVATVIAAPRVPGLGLRQRQLQTAGAAGLFGLAPVAFAATAVVVAVVIVVAEPEEPHEPHDESPDVEDAEPDHEDPSLQGHVLPSLSQASQSVNHPSIR
jgi:hypothetical protein